MALFSKSSIVGVSVTPEIGLEVAEIDFASHRVLKYASKPLDYNVNTRQVADMDIFKETLEDLLLELGIDKKTKIVLNIPSVTFRISEFPAMMDEVETTNAITETLMSNPLFENDEICYDATKLPNASTQFNKILYTAAQHNVVYEMAYAINSIGYKIYAIDTSVSSTYNALNYAGLLGNIEADTSWIMLIVENGACRVIPMIGYHPVDVYEERISIGEVLGDTENYATVLSSVMPVLKNTPSKYLYVVSKTNIISAEVLASKIQYGAPIIHQEANAYVKEQFLDTAPSVDVDIAKQISLDVIGAAIRADIEAYKVNNLNLYNRTLGDLYTLNQPPEINFFGRRIVLSPEFLIKSFIILLLLCGVAAGIVAYIYNNKIAEQKAEMAKIDNEIAIIQKYLDENKGISSDAFDEGDEIRLGLVHNKAIYSYYTIVGTEIPRKLWLTHLKLGDKITIEGQADNLESVYGFFRSIKDYNQGASDLKLQKLGLASNSRSSIATNDDNFDTESILTTLNADFYEFRISNEPEVKPKDLKESVEGALPAELEPIN